jgi:nitrogen fixation NifU-like protein
MSLYREEILDHYKHPRNFGVLSDATVKQEGDNVPCGDRIHLMLKLNNGFVQDIKFQGEGCALSIAATSMLTEMVNRTSLATIQNVSEADMVGMVIHGNISPDRLHCVLLGWKTLKKAIAQVGAENFQPLQNSTFVTRDMNLGEIAARWPQARTVLLDYGLHCVGCFASSFDTIEAGAKVHGMSEEDIDKLIRELNNAIRCE